MKKKIIKRHKGPRRKAGTTRAEGRNAIITRIIRERRKGMNKRAQEIMDSPELHEAMCQEMERAKAEAGPHYQDQMLAIRQVLRKWYLGD